MAGEVEAREPRVRGEEPRLQERAGAEEAALEDARVDLTGQEGAAAGVDGGGEAMEVVRGRRLCAGFTCEERGF